MGFLYKIPTHGYDLHRRMVEEFGGVWHTSQSQTYNILKRLEAQGYIQSTFVEQEKLPARQLLTITGAGSKRFEEWLRQPTKSSVHAIRVEFITRLYFTQLYFPARTVEVLNRQLLAVEGGMSELSKSLERTPQEQVSNRLAIELRIKLLRSVIDWLNECQGLIITPPAKGGQNA